MALKISLYVSDPKWTDLGDFIASHITNFSSKNKKTICFSLSFKE